MARPSLAHTASLLCLAAVVAAGCGGPAKPASSGPPPAPVTTVDVPAASPSTTVAPSTTASTAAPTTSVPPTTVKTSTPETTRPAPVSAATASCSVDLAQSLESTGDARQLITVVGAGYDTTVAEVEIWQRSGSCWTLVGGPWSGNIGENGFADHHIEGDGTTPTGIYDIGPVMYGNAPNPGTQEPYHRLVCGDWWDEDPTSPAYNTFQHVTCGESPPFGGGSEALWTETPQYPSFAVVDYNADPVVPYAGSAIFLHANTGSPTTGCVSIPLPDLDRVLRWINPAYAPAIAMGPSSEITRF